MPEGFFSGTDVGGIILRAAQGIVQQSQAQQQMAIQQEQLAQQAKQQSTVFDLRAQELDLRERAISVQEAQTSQRQQFAPLIQQQKEADIALTNAKIAKTNADAARGPGGGLTAKQQLDVTKDIFATARGLQYDSLAQQAGLPALGSREAYLKEHRRLEGEIKRFEGSMEAVITGINRGKGAQNLQIDQIMEKKRLLDSFIASEGFRTIEIQRPPDELIEQVKTSRYGEFAPQIDTSFEVPPDTLPGFEDMPERQVNAAWDMFDQGNPDLLKEAILDSSEEFGPAEQAALADEMLRRYPTKGPEQDAALARYRQLIQSIAAERSR